MKQFKTKLSLLTLTLLSLVALALFLNSHTVNLDTSTINLVKKHIEPVQEIEIAEKKQPIKPIYFEVIKVKKGDTLSSILQKYNLSSDQSAEIVTGLKKIFDPSKLKTGQKIIVSFDPKLAREGISTFQAMEIRADDQTEIVISRNENNVFKSEKIAKEKLSRLVKAEGKINFSLFSSATNAGTPEPVILKFVKLYSYDVDFQREVQKGDKFEILYEEFYDKEGDVTGYGDIVFSNFSLSGQDLKAYRYTIAGQVEYFDGNGHSIRKDFLRTPVDGAKITSGFGRRTHPTLGYTKLHKGVDFGAPTGTPVYAAANGTIREMGRKGSYGNYVRIAHGNGNDTAYAHLSRFANNLSKGSRVKQGTVIGFVGSTGRSTGPHLHYEVIAMGKQINPLSIKSVAGTKLSQNQLAKFKQFAQNIDKLSSDVMLAKREASLDKNRKNSLN